MDYLPQVRAAIVKVIPGIGKWVQQKPFIVCRECVGGLTADEEGENIDVCINCAGTRIIPNPEAGKPTVIELRRKITIVDVLRTIAGEANAFWHLDTAGDMFDQDPGDGSPLYRAHWDLSTDSLDEQPPETLAFLHSILCKGDE